MNSSDIDEEHLKKLKAFAACASISVSLTLSIIKAGAAIVTGSLSVLSSMVDSLTDVISSSISLVAVKFANKPLTEHHRYGYGKAESVSALIQAAFIAGSGGFIFYDGICRLMNPAPLKQTAVGLWIMGVSIVLTVGLITLQSAVVKRPNRRQ